MTQNIFLVPDFDKNIPDKVNQEVEVKSKNTLSANCAIESHPATASNGFSSKKDGVYVYVTRVDDIGTGRVMAGFTDTATYDSTKAGWVGGKLSGTSLNC